MSSKFLISLIVIILVNITNSETDQNGNTNTNENTPINENDLCGNINASSRSDCFILSNPDSFCCYNSTDQKCISVLKAELKNTTLDCGITDNNYGKYEFWQYHPKQDFDLDFQTCGEYNPKKKEDCLKYSEIANSCCFFKNSAGATGCFYIGKRYSGDLEEKTFVLDGVQLTYECIGYYYESFNFYLIFFFVILFF